MASFETHRRRVHDTGRTVRARHSALRTCLVAFAPYGFRATYHHLCRSARIPRDLEKDPASLIRAVEELDAARRHWLADEAVFVARRRQEKAAGVRRPQSDGSWRDAGRASSGMPAYCPNPEFHPDEPLPAVVKRVLGSVVLPTAASSWCLVCGRAGATTRWRSECYVHRLCARCGVSLSAERTAANSNVCRARAERWSEIWRREA
ncbi:hypothetical protein [Streptomyces sp. CB02488]|uniref:hypothetical protein n=1 Tax=Streptomyces sp. CB02488 TaxID=1703920 RepID=UPI00093912B5|nr:hypothetical protein [Streptomyces sp. CB02488]